MSEELAPPVGPIRILLGNRALTRVVGAFGGVTVAEWGYVTALSVDAFRRDGAIAVGLVGLRLFLAAASSFMSAAFIYRRAGRRVLSEIAGVRAVGVAASAVLAAVGAPLAPLLALLALDALLSAQYRPTQSALIPALARTPQELVASATGLSTVKTLSQAFGSVLGGLLLAVTSPAVVFTGVSLTFLAAAAATLQFRGVGAPGGAPPSSTGVRQVMRDTAKVVRNPHIAGILVVSGLRTFVRGMWISIAVIASLKLLHAGSAGVGLLMLAAGIGSLVAAPLSSMLVRRPRLGTPAAVALVGCGIPLAVIAGVPVFDVALALVAAWGVGMAVADVAASSLLYRLLDAPVVPRVTGAIESTKLALEGLGGFLAPLLVATIGVRGALLFASLPLPIVVASGWKLLHQVDATAQERSALLALVHSVHCLEPLDMASLDGLVGRLQRVAVPDADTDVIRQRDPGDCFYIIETGTAQVLVDGFVVGNLGPRDSFGERALLRNVPRTATVRSCEPMRLLSLSRADFLTALSGYEAVGTQEGLGGQEAAATQSVESSTLMSEAGWTRRQRVEVLSRLNLLSHLDSKAMGQLADRSVIERWPAGASIVSQGADGDRFFVLLEGRAAVSVDAGQVSELRAGDQFGEIALLHGVPRSADVVASNPVLTLSLHRDDFMPAVRSRLLLG